MTMTSDTAAPGETFDWMAPHMRIDPYPTLRRFRDADPMQRNDLGWWVLGFPEADLVLKDARFGRDRDVFLADFKRSLGDGPAYEYVVRRMTYYGPPDHHRIRGIVAGAFTPRRINGLRPYITALTAELLGRADGQDRFDLLEVVAHPLPSLVICELLGVPPSLRGSFDTWTQTIAHLVAPRVTDEQLARGTEVVVEEWAAVEDLVSHRSAHLGDDLLSALISAEHDGARLTREELVANVMFMFSAGHQTTRDALGMGVLALLENHEQWEALVRDPAGRAGPATEEVLRFESPVCLAIQQALVDAEIGGRTVRRGDMLNVVLNAVNRDPRRFEDPERFDIDRPRNHPMAFSAGAHLCLGAALARVEISVVLEALATRFPKLRLGSAPLSWRETVVFRGPESLPVET